MFDPDWFKRRKKELRLSDTAIGAAIGRDRSVANRIINGSLDFDMKHLDGLAKAFQVGKEELLFRFGVLDQTPMHQPDHPPVRNASADDGTIEITALDLSLSMGPGTHIDAWVESEPVRFDTGFLRAITRSPFNRLRLVRGIGDSMYPTLNGGDAIMIDTTQNSLSRQDGIYWISLHGAAGIKRLRTVAKDRVMIISDNPNVENYEAEAQDLRIEGRAIWFARDL